MAEIVAAADAGRWEAVAGDRMLDPHCLREFAIAQAGEGTTPVLVRAAGKGWSVLEVLEITEVGGGHRTARAPLYGGPWLKIATDDADMARRARREIDAALRDLSVISEVTVHSPWLPEPDLVRQAWQGQATRSVCLASLSHPDQAWAALPPGRRTEIRHACREGIARWRCFDEEQAVHFAAVYRSAMDRLRASQRWRLDRPYFEKLSREAGRFVHLAAIELPTGGAAALFLHNGRRAAYLFAARWGQAGGAAAAALWTGIVELGRMGIEEMLLGGGTTDTVDDSLLRFKSAFADRRIPLLVSARVFDREAHSWAAAMGRARPLPAFALDA
ncbi:MAG TPA: hypothetical protein VEK76_05915 [Candidatus Binatia bacterium]|nr:hypothetical protein [Candidatus Binatia bacterium]